MTDHSIDWILPKWICTNRVSSLFWDDFICSSSPWLSLIPLQTESRTVGFCFSHLQRQQHLVKSKWDAWKLELHWSTCSQDAAWNHYCPTLEAEEETGFNLQKKEFGFSHYSLVVMCLFSQCTLTVKLLFCLFIGCGLIMINHRMCGEFLSELQSSCCPKQY